MLRLVACSYMPAALLLHVDCCAAADAKGSIVSVTPDPLTQPSVLLPPQVVITQEDRELCVKRYDAAMRAYYTSWEAAVADGYSSVRKVLTAPAESHLHAATHRLRGCSGITMRVGVVAAVCGKPLAKLHACCTGQHRHPWSGCPDHFWNRGPVPCATVGGNCDGRSACLRGASASFLSVFVSSLL